MFHWILTPSGTSYPLGVNMQGTLCLLEVNYYLTPANEVCEGYVFTCVCHSVHRGWVSRPRPRVKVKVSGRGGSRPTAGGEVGGSGWGVSRPKLGGVQAYTWGGPGPHRGWCIPACTEADFPSRWLLLRAVRILLECILV